MSKTTPLLIATKGHPATGKSLVASALARRLHSPLIDKDDIKDHILEVADANKLSYAIMWQLVATQLRHRLCVVAVSPLSYPEEYATAQALAAKYKAHLLVVETTLEEREWKRRLNARQSGYSTHKISGWEAMQETLRQYNDCWKYPIAPEQHVVLNTVQPLNELVKQVMDRVEVLRRTAV